ncbi:MAG: methyltransferase [Chloroflexota bacterium]|nr:methyltransferase [Chloroflexota bacterium]MDE2896157.1 methyltransferase [Chloroflexota bacterium]
MNQTSVEQDHLTPLRERLAKHPEVAIDAERRQLILRSRHGLFSARSIDEGTELLLRELQALTQATRVLDLGCGYGAIGLTLAARWPDAHVDLIDTDIRAVEATRENITRNRLDNAAVNLSDGIRDLPNTIASYDLVVSNLPAQAGNDAIDQLLLDAYDALNDRGSLAVVAVNGLRRYLQRRLADIFGKQQVRKVHQGPRHTVLEAAKLRT